MTREVEMDIVRCANNSVTDRLGVKNEIHKLAKKYNETDKDACILPCAEFRNSFNPYSSITSSEGLLFHSLTSQCRDLRHDSFKCTYLVAL